MIIGAKSGAHSGLSAVIGSKNNNSHMTMGSKGGAPSHHGRAVYTQANRAMGDMGGGKSAPGNTHNSVGGGQRDAPSRPDGIRSMADPRPSKRAKTTESGKKNKAE
ncbi:hypothetical protein TVWG_00003 [Tetraselmis viridis virus N1]|uniref:Uncharacterized protein n=1 Tax=Tetraselmis viridis virus S1 TaxID=756285 RepID=M4QR80_9VIRU|nr:hypothetical protein TVSG_00019 [Tetraselmis viridis virus S1]AET84768.1 hypothetical protein TVWG_00003 [Tetraselmis viridis virus N1]AGH30819.1 hypothetical protein TVSG_00019 [Tetraselmis viridis virus S1]